MKKLLVVMIVVFAITSIAMAAERPTWAGWDSIVYGWPTFNELGQMTELAGISILGYAWRTYFNPVQIGQVNFYWEWGLNALVLGVQGGVGLTYPLPLENTILYLGGSINVLWGALTVLIPIPYPNFAVAIIF